MYNGIINVYKEPGYTSFDVVAKLRGILKEKKVGHTGTLDPDAAGVLPVVVGNATKLVDMLTDKKKEYIAEFKLGITTDTQDISGRVIERKDVECSEDEVREAIDSFVGDIMQIPPMYSAIKVDGKKLYELARDGKEVERSPRPVTIYEIETKTVDLRQDPVVIIRVVCSKGTYIRTLCHDIGQKLGCGATMTSLIRTMSGQFRVEGALPLSEIEEYIREGKEDRVIIPTDAFFEDIGTYTVEGKDKDLVRNGNKITLADTCEEKLRIYSSEGFMAVYELQDEKSHVYRPRMMFL